MLILAVVFYGFFILLNAELLFTYLRLDYVILDFIKLEFPKIDTETDDYYEDRINDIYKCKIDIQEHNLRIPRSY